MLYKQLAVPAAYAAGIAVSGSGRMKRGNIDLDPGNASGSPRIVTRKGLCREMHLEQTNGTRADHLLGVRETRPENCDSERFLW